MKTVLLTSLLLVFNVLAFSLHAATYFVSPTGSNSNTGTSESKPWQSISKVNTKNFNGDTILFQGGSTFSLNGFGKACKVALVIGMFLSAHKLLFFSKVTKKMF